MRSFKEFLEEDTSISSMLAQAPGGATKKTPSSDSDLEIKAHHLGWKSGFGNARGASPMIKSEHMVHFNKGVTDGKKKRLELEKKKMVVPDSHIRNPRTGTKKPNNEFEKVYKAHAPWFNS